MAGANMQQLTREIESHIYVHGDDYRVTLLGHARPDGIWEGRVAFAPLTFGGDVIETPVETTQPDERALIRWAEGLSNTFFDGAFRRALAKVSRKPQAPRRKAIVSTNEVDPKDVERRILECFRHFKSTTLNRQTLFASIDEFSNADVIRAIESLEHARVVSTQTDRGSVWIERLTPA
jgi:hypothetical protein